MIAYFLVMNSKRSNKSNKGFNAFVETTNCGCFIRACVGHGPLPNCVRMIPNVK